MSKGNFTIAEVEVSLDKHPFNDKYSPGYQVCMMRETAMNAKINCGKGRYILPEDAEKIGKKIRNFKKSLWSDIQAAEKRYKAMANCRS